MAKSSTPPSGNPTGGVWRFVNGHPVLIGGTPTATNHSSSKEERYKGVRFKVRDEDLEHAATVLGRKVTKEELADLAGAHTAGASVVRISPDDEEEDMIRVSVRGPHITRMSRQIRKHAVVNDVLELKDDAPVGTGTSILTGQVEAARAQGVNWLLCNAARADESPEGKPVYVGYKVWPKLGYDGDLPYNAAVALAKPEQAGLRKALASQNLSGERVSDYYRLGKEGIEFWEQHGGTFEAEFDTRADSLSSRVLDAYNKKRKAGGK